MKKPQLEGLVTEAQNPRTMDLDAMDTPALLAVMNDEDRSVADAVRRQLPAIARAVDAIAARLQSGGRLFYCGAGTSGRLGALDAAECGPTFGSDPRQVVGLIAGGPQALGQAVEGAEDDEALGASDLRAMRLSAADCVVGIAASGRTPYVLGALAYARETGALTVAVVCNAQSPVAAAASIPIEVVVGPEVLAGSTRLKAGTATKLVLNMLSTGAFVRCNKVYRNLMVDLRATNGKLKERSVRIVVLATRCSAAAAGQALAACGGEVKCAIVTLLHSIPPAAAKALLAANDGSVRAALAQ